MQNIKIVSPKPSENGLAPTQETHVYAGDTELHGVRSIDVHYRPDDVVKADVELYVWPGDVFARGTFWIKHPTTGERAQISKIEFADGSEFKC